VVQVPFLTQNWVDIAATADSALRGGGPEFKNGLPEHVQQGGDHLDTLDEGDYGQDWDSPDEEENQQRAGSNPSSSLHENRPYDLDDDDRQIVLTLSEFPQVDKEVARRLTKLESIKVLSCEVMPSNIMPYIFCTLYIFPFLVCCQAIFLLFQCSYFTAVCRFSQIFTTKDTKCVQ
jgi:hypothetical protein